VCIATFRRDAPALRPFADERRIVVGEEGGRVRTPNAHPAPFRLQSVEQPPSAPKFPPVDPVRETGVTA
jgi:hypothetical protein